MFKSTAPSLCISEMEYWSIWYKVHTVSKNKLNIPIILIISFCLWDTWKHRCSARKAACPEPKLKNRDALFQLKIVSNDVTCFWKSYYCSTYLFLFHREVCIDTNGVLGFRLIWLLQSWLRLVRHSIDKFGSGRRDRFSIIVVLQVRYIGIGAHSVIV